MILFAAPAAPCPRKGKSLSVNRYFILLFISGWE
jgi:hypothetical protein